MTVTWTDAGDRLIEQFAADVDLTGQTPTGTEPIYKARLTSRTAYTYGSDGQQTSQRGYYDADAASGGYHETFYRHELTPDTAPRRVEIVVGPPASATDSTRTWRKTVYNVRGQAWKVYEGAGVYTSDSTPEPDNMRLLAQYYYDDEEDDPENVGEGRLTRTRTYFAHSPAEKWADVDSEYDDEGRLDVQLLPGDVASKQTYDFQGRVTVGEQWERSGSTLTTLLTKSETLYDELGRAYQTKGYRVVSGTASDYLKSDTYRDKNGRTRKTASPGGQVSRSDYDGAGRTTASWSQTSTGTVLSQADYAYNKVGATLAVRTKSLRSDATGQTDGDFLFTYSATWYDAGHRPEVSAFNGDKNTSSWWPTPGGKPSASDADWIVTKSEYDTAGRLLKSYDPKGIVTRNEYNDLGQLTSVTEDDGGIGRVTEFTYNGDGQIRTRKALAPAPGEDDQTTTYFYNTIDNTNGTASAENGLLAVLCG